MAPVEQPARVGLTSRLSAGQLLALVTAVPLVMVIVAVAVGLIQLSHQGSVRSELLERLEPANLAASQLGTALVDQETGIRGYELTAQTEFLQPYRLGEREAAAAFATLRRAQVVGTTSALSLLQARVAAWQTEIAQPALTTIRPGHPATRATVGAGRGKVFFDRIRTALDRLQSKIAARVMTVRSRLASAANTTTATLAVIAALLALGALGIALTLRRTVAEPLTRLARSARRVAGGELDHELTLSGPRDIAVLAGDVESMRTSLAGELAAAEQARAALERSASELARSNTELERFAYVASHDLQEPLRKVTSFVQLLSERYRGQLDERADQYIDFAVDGAERMQALIQDLLAFSRVGRIGEQRERVELRSLLDAALKHLDGSLEETGAELEIGELPTVTVERSLLRVVFQNLLSNAIKFHGDDPPRIRVDCERQGTEWEFSVSDNGIGVEPEYAERVFVIFQRLHGRSDYPGTGIGLAMARKVIEHHGGRIWLDTAYSPGTRIRFILPVDGQDLAYDHRPD
jgi:signal transduction histidine kinase